MMIDEIIQALNDFKPFSEDDPVNDNKSFLSDLMHNLNRSQDYKKAIPAIFHLFERYPLADLGSPGP